MTAFLVFADSLLGTYADDVVGCRLMAVVGL